MGKDIATYRYYMGLVKQHKATDTQPHLKELYDRAIAKFQLSRSTNPNLLDQIRIISSQHTNFLEEKSGHKLGQQAINDAFQIAQIPNVQQSNLVQQQLLQQQQQQAAQQQQQQQQQAQVKQPQISRAMNAQGQQETIQMPTPQVNMPQPQINMQQYQALRAQAQGIARTTSTQGGMNQPMTQPQQNIPQQSQVSNPMQNTTMTPQQAAMLQQMQLQQRQQLANNQQILSNLTQGSGLPTNQMTPAQIHQFQQIQQQQQQAQQLQQARAAGGDSATSGVILPNSMLPREANPHNFPIPHDSQQRLVAIGVPSDKLMSWNEVISWLQEAYKATIINDEQYNKVKAEYHSVSLRMNQNPQAYWQAKQLQARNAAAAGLGNMSTSNQLLLQQMQARQQQLAAGQQSQVPQTMQNTPQTMPPQVQMNMAGIPQLQQQMPPQQPQAPSLQTQVSQQQQQPPPQTQQQQAQNPQPQRKGRAPQKKPPAKKGQDATNPMV